MRTIIPTIIFTNFSAIVPAITHIYLISARILAIILTIPTNGFAMAFAIVSTMKDIR